MWKFHVDESTQGRHNMIPGIYLLTDSVLDLKFYGWIIVGVKIWYEGCSSPMVDVSNYNYAPLTDKSLNRNNLP